MAARNRSKRYNLKTYLVYGKYPVGNHTLQVLTSKEEKRTQ